MKKTFWVAPVVLALVGCGGGGSKEASSGGETPAATPAEAPVDTANAGTVTGKVAYTGAKPAMRNIDMSSQPACARQHTGGAPKSEEVVVNGNGTLKNVFVWVKSGLPDRQWPTPAEAVKLDQHQCVYTPHVIGVMANQPIEIHNSDPTNHNIHPLPKVNREWNESQPPKGEVKTKTFPRQEIMIPVKCNVHPWMRAYIGVVSHPYFAITGDDGSFEIKNLPPGTYTIEAWHEKFGTQEMQVTVAPKESKAAEFTFKG